MRQRGLSISSLPFTFDRSAPPLARSAGNASASCSPRKIEMIAGGPRWRTEDGGRSPPTRRPRAACPPCLCTARITAAQEDELRVGVRRVARIQQVALRRVADREVDVLARAVDARRTASRAAGTPCRALRRPLQVVMISLLVVVGEVGGLLEDRSDLRTGPAPPHCDCLDGDACLNSSRSGHEGCQHRAGDRAEVVVRRTPGPWARPRRTACARC